MDVSLLETTGKLQSSTDSQIDLSTEITLASTASEVDQGGKLMDSPTEKKKGASSVSITPVVTAKQKRTRPRGGRTNNVDRLSRTDLLIASYFLIF